MYVYTLPTLVGAVQSGSIQEVYAHWEKERLSHTQYNQQEMGSQKQLLSAIFNSDSITAVKAWVARYSNDWLSKTLAKSIPKNEMFQQPTGTSIGFFTDEDSCRLLKSWIL